MTIRADVALLVHSLSGGGAERICLNLCHEFNARGLVVDLVLCRAQGAFLSSLPQGIRLIDCSSDTTVRWTQAVFRYMGGQPAPVLLAFMEGAGLVAIAARMLSRSTIRVIISSHNMISIHQAEQTSVLQRIVFPTVARALIPRADGFIGVSEGVTRDFARYFDLRVENVKTIYNPVIEDQAMFLAKKAPTHPWLAEPKGARSRTIVSAGRLTRQKGFDTLIKAFARAHATQRDLRLIIFGEGEERELLTQLASDLGILERVSLPGFVENPYAAFANADLFVMSSRWEGLPTVLIEALACGCPVVSTNCKSGPSEILEDGAWGTLVPVDDVISLCWAILQTLADPLPQESLRARGCVFSVSRSADAYLKVLGIDQE